MKELIETDESIATFKADTSVYSSVAAKYLKELGAKGIPLIVIDGPGVNEPILAEFYTFDSLTGLIDQARGK
jgi:thiol:disulfide interchange protein